MRKGNSDMLDNFKLYFPMMAQSAEYCFQSGPFEVTANMEDGSKLIYNDLQKTVRYIKDGDCEKVDENEWLINFGKNLRATLSKIGASQDWLSKETGIPQPTISQVVRGKRKLTHYETKLIADALQCSVSELYYFN